MITYNFIYNKVNSKELTLDEKSVLDEFISICSDKIKAQFPGQDVIYVPQVVIDDTFRSKRIPSKRQDVILHWLEQDAKNSGWKMTHDEDYYKLEKLK